MVVCRPWLTLDAALKGVIAACVSRIGTMSNWVLSKMVRVLSFLRMLERPLYLWKQPFGYDRCEGPLMTQSGR
jgi:hypothetical protein